MQIRLHALLHNESTKCVVWLGSTPNHSRVAIKQYDTHDKRLMTREIDIMKALKHVNVLTFLFAYQKLQTSYIGLEYASDGNLSTYITIKGKLQKQVVQDYTVQVMKALEHLHTKNIIHRNIAPENIMLTNDFRQIKVGGFSNMCNLPNHGDCVSLRGDNIEYLAPEQILQSEVDCACDIWGIGCLISEMLYGMTPFTDDDPIKVVQRILQVEHTSIWHSTVASRDMSWLLQFIQYDSYTRPALISLQNDKWLTESDECVIVSGLLHMCIEDEL